jgi:hypothetical protein
VDYGFSGTCWAALTFPFATVVILIVLEATLRMTKKTTRIQLELPESSIDTLNALKDKIGEASYSEVIKTALQSYEALISQAESGKSAHAEKQG